MGGQDDDPGLGRYRVEVVEGGQPVHARHDQVEQDAVEGRLAGQLDRLDAVGRGGDLVALALQDLLEGRRDPRVVVDHEDPSPLAWHWSPPLRWADRRPSLKRTLAPRGRQASAGPARYNDRSDHAGAVARGAPGSSGQGGSAMTGLMMDYPLTLTHFFERSRRLFAKKQLATRVPGGPLFRYTYGEFANRVGRLAGALGALGIGGGDRVGTFAWNSHRHLELYWAA